MSVDKTTWDDWLKIKDKKRKAKYQKHMHIAKKIAKAYYNKIPSYSKLKNKESLDDLVSEAQIAMLEDITNLYNDEKVFNRLYNEKKQDITVGPYYLGGNFHTPFILKSDTKSIKFIKGRVIDYMRDHDMLSKDDRAKVSKVQKFIDRFETKHGKYPSDSDFKSELGMSKREAEKILSVQVSEVSYDDLYGESEIIVNKIMNEKYESSDMIKIVSKNYSKFEGISNKVFRSVKDIKSFITKVRAFPVNKHVEVGDNLYYIMCNFTKLILLRFNKNDEGYVLNGYYTYNPNNPDDVESNTLTNNDVFKMIGTKVRLVDDKVLKSIDFSKVKFYTVNDNTTIKDIINNILVGFKALSKVLRTPKIKYALKMNEDLDYVDKMVGQQADDKNDRLVDIYLGDDSFSSVVLIKNHNYIFTVKNGKYIQTMINDKGLYQVEYPDVESMIDAIRNLV